MRVIFGQYIKPHIKEAWNLYFHSKNIYPSLTESDKDVSSDKHIVLDEDKIIINSGP